MKDPKNTEIKFYYSGIILWVFAFFVTDIILVIATVVSLADERLPELMLYLFIPILILCYFILKKIVVVRLLPPIMIINDTTISFPSLSPKGELGALFSLKSSLFTTLPLKNSDVIIGSIGNLITKTNIPEINHETTNLVTLWAKNKRDEMMSSLGKNTDPNLVHFNNFIVVVSGNNLIYGTGLDNISKRNKKKFIQLSKERGAHVTILRG